MGIYRFTYSGTIDLALADSEAHELASSMRRMVDGLDVTCVHLDYDASWLPESHRAACAAIEFAVEQKYWHRPHRVVFDGSWWATDGCAVLRCEPSNEAQCKHGSILASYRRPRHFCLPSDPHEVPGPIGWRVELNQGFTLDAKYVELVEAIWPRVVWHAPASTADGPAHAVLDGKTVAFVMGVRR